MSDNFEVIIPTRKRLPFILSIPHVGQEFPPELEGHYVASLAAKPDDTDFYLDQVYDFAQELGITCIYAKYSRWVIDLNRTPKSEPLYDDGRIITALCPVRNFKGQPIYQESRFEPDEKELERRKKNYYYPYYAKIAALIAELRESQEDVLFWDAHSIREYVPAIQADKFPPMILGNNDETSAAPRFIKQALDVLQKAEPAIQHNRPFKGGNLTRKIGNPAAGVHALQLEMIKSLYMDDAEEFYHTDRANQLKKVLKSCFESLIELL